MQNNHDILIVAGPVIVEDGKVLLIREKKADGPLTPWFFPGGKVENFDLTLEETAVRECQEEMGIKIEILRPLSPLLMRRPEAPEKFVILIHYLARRIGEINPSPQVAEWRWIPLNELPAEGAPNVQTIINELKKEYALPASPKI